MLGKGVPQCFVEWQSQSPGMSHLERNEAGNPRIRSPNVTPHRQVGSPSEMNQNGNPNELANWQEWKTQTIICVYFSSASNELLRLNTLRLQKS